MPLSKNICLCNTMCLKYYNSNHPSNCKAEIFNLIFVRYIYTILILKEPLMLRTKIKDSACARAEMKPTWVSNPFLRLSALYAGQPPCAYTHMENNRTTSTIRMHNMNQLRQDNYGSNKSQMRSPFIRPRATLRRSQAQAMPTQLNDWYRDSR